MIESGGVSRADEMTEQTDQPIRVKNKRANEIPYLIIQSWPTEYAQW